MRTAGGLLLLLAACSSGASDTSGAPVAEQTDNVIDCAVGGATAFAHTCAVERSEEQGALVLVVQHPDGGFRRFEVLDGGHSLTPADGAEAGRTTKTADGLEVAVGGDRYRFPAKMLSDEGSH
jgi:hypothetical protein